MLQRCYEAYMQQYSQQDAGRIQQASRIQQAYSRLQECRPDAAGMHAAGRQQGCRMQAGKMQPGCRPAGPCNMLSKKLSKIEKSACNMQS
jgi:hypothetical protein